MGDTVERWATRPDGGLRHGLCSGMVCAPVHGAQPWTPTKRRFGRHSAGSDDEVRVHKMKCRFGRRGAGSGRCSARSGMKVDARLLSGVASKVRLATERVRFRAGAVGWQVNMGMIGFDVGHGVGRSGPRMQSQLVNVLCKTIGAKSNNRTDFALAA